MVHRYAFAYKIIDFYKEWCLGLHLLIKSLILIRNGASWLAPAQNCSNKKTRFSWKCWFCIVKHNEFAFLTIKNRWKLKVFHYLCCQNLVKYKLFNSSGVKNLVFSFVSGSQECKIIVFSNTTSTFSWKHRFFIFQNSSGLEPARRHHTL